jgi:outer membrane protein assembly factor BamB
MPLFQRHIRYPVSAALAAALLLATRGASSADWPGWRGPNRDGISQETGLLKDWPKGGPPLAYKATGLGEGYSSVSVAGGRIFTMGNRDGREFVIALSEKDGREVWASPVGPVRHDGSGYAGPRCTPTVDGGLVYALGINGDLLCLTADSGKERWRKDLKKDFGGHTPGWGYSESPLIDGDRLLCTPGGKDVTIAALDKKNGAVIWKAAVPHGAKGTKTEAESRKTDGAQYSSIVKGEAAGVKQYVQLLSSGVAGVAASNGAFLWRYNPCANGTANISTPIIHDSSVFSATGYGTGGGLVKLTAKGGRIEADEVYFVKQMKNHHGGLVLLGEDLYGFDEGVLRCLDWKTGNEAWHDRSVGKGSLVYADGRLYARSEDGPVALVEATPKGYEERGRFKQPDRSGKNAWPHPVVANGRLYLRDQDVLLVYDVRQGGATQAGPTTGRKASF